MEIDCKKIITELRVIKEELEDVSLDNTNFNTCMSIVKAKTSLDVLINLMED